MHVENVLSSTPSVTQVDLDVVDGIAALPRGPHQRRAWTHLSFASKLCHFFISAERFPIYDSHAVRVLSMHVGRRIRRDVGTRYADFADPFFRARDTVGCNTRELDRYLWLRGSFDAWSKSTSKAQVNVELKGLFVDGRSQELLRELSADTACHGAESAHQGTLTPWPSSSPSTARRTCP